MDDKECSSVLKSVLMRNKRVVKQCFLRRAAFACFLNEGTIYIQQNSLLLVDFFECSHVTTTTIRIETMSVFPKLALCSVGVVPPLTVPGDP